MVDQPCIMFFLKICAFLYMDLYVNSFFSICLTASTRSASLGVAQYMFIDMATSLLLMSDLRIISFNTQGLRGINKRIYVLEYLKDKTFCICWLQYLPSCVHVDTDANTSLLILD